MAIQRLTGVQDLAPDDQVALYSMEFGGDARVPLTILAAYLETLLTIPQAFQTQYASPNASGFTVTVAPLEAGGNVYLLLTPGGAYAAGTIALPSGEDGQEVLCNCTQAVTALTVSATVGSVVGAPTTLAANGFFRMRFDGVGVKWYRVG